MRNALIAVSVLVVLSTSSAFAASREELAKQVAEMSLSREAWNDMIEKMTGDAEAALASRYSGDQAGGAKVQKAFRLAMKEMMISYEEVIDLQLGLLVKYYSASELAELQKFYKTELGKKMLRVMPEMTRDVSAAMNARIQTGLQGAMRRAFEQVAAEDAAPAAPVKAKPQAPVKK